MKSSSAPLKRKITGWCGTQLESTISLAISSIDAEKGRKYIKTWYDQGERYIFSKYNLSNTMKTSNIVATNQHMNHNHQHQGNQGDYQNVRSLKLMDRYL
jgi:hypothetical protein